MLRGAVAALLVACASAPQPRAISLELPAPKRTKSEPAFIDTTLAAERIATISGCVPKGFALDKTTAFVSCQDGLITTIDLTTHVVTPLMRLNAEFLPFHLPLAVDATDLFFVGSYTQLFSVPKTGGKPTLLANNCHALSLRVHGGQLFIAARGKGVLRLLNGATQLVAPAGRPEDLVLDGQSLYFADYVSGADSQHLFGTPIAQPKVTDLGPIDWGHFIVANDWLYSDGKMTHVPSNVAKKLAVYCNQFAKDGGFVFAHCPNVLGTRVGSDGWITLGRFSHAPEELAVNDASVCASVVIGTKEARIECLARPTALRP
jgi:hypothetical protein